MQPAVGAMVAAAGAAGLGLAIALSRFAYQGGSNGLTLAMVRSVLMLLLLLFICQVRGPRVRLSLPERLHCLGLGVLMFVMAYGNVGAVEFISVGLTALLFYTFPPMVAVIHATVLRERLALAKLGAIGLAFAGLVLMLSASIGVTDWRGVALALAAAAATAWHAVWLNRRLPQVDILLATLHMALVAAPILVALTLIAGELQWPSGRNGWLGLVSVAVLQAGSLPLYIIAINAIGSLKTAMISNVQPVTSIVAAYWLFGELLTARQLLGGTLVLFGIGLMQWFDSRRQSTAVAAKP